MFQIVLDGFFPKPGADYSSTSSSNPDKTFIFVNNRPVHQKDVMKVESFWITRHNTIHTISGFFVSNNILLCHVYVKTLCWLDCVIDHQLLRQHYTAQYQDDPARNRYPTAMLKITVPPSSVDVNLTPDKTQVLLHNKVAMKFIIFGSNLVRQHFSHD